MKAKTTQPRSFLWYLLVCIFTLLTVAGNAQLAADFSADVQTGCTPLVVHFSDQSTGSPSRWNWDLGNRTSSNLQHPSVTYFAPGLYAVKLVVYSGNLKDSIVKTNYIQVLPSPVANFTANITAGCSPMPVNFTDQSQAGAGDIRSWKWDFGDGNLDSVQHPAHTYVQVGVKSVTLQVRNSGGCIGTLRKAAYISTGSIAASFTQRVLSTCASNKYVFKNTSTGVGALSRQWFFGDGTTSGLDSVVHTYNNGGTYSVKLVVRSQSGCIDSATTTITVASPLNAVFNADKTYSCKTPFRVNFTSQSIPGTLYRWSFGNGDTSSLANPSYAYRDSGNYTVRLVVRHPNGCSDSFTRVRYIQVQKIVNYIDNLPDSNCAPFAKTFVANINSSVPRSSIVWQFGDGTSSTQESPSHTYNNYGSYDVTLITTTSNGCSDTILTRRAILVSPKPVARFSANALNVCGKVPVVFSNLSTGEVTSSYWSYGDDQFSIEREESHIYVDTGWMTVSLVAANGGCADTSILQNYIYIKPAVAKFTVEMKCQTPLVRTFKNKSLGAHRYFWDFGDSTTSTLFEPVHTFPRPGFYTVQLTAFNDSTGCDYLFKKVVRIIDLVPDFTVSDAVVCKGIPDTFIATPGVSAGISRYLWAFGEGRSTSVASPVTSYAYQRPGLYTVTLIVRDSLNCNDTVVKPLFVKVNGPKAVIKAVPSVGCINQPILFVDSSSAGDSGPINQAVMLYGDGSLDTLSGGPITHAYITEGTFRVLLKLRDSSGCTDSVRINPSLVIHKLKPQFTVSDTIVCPGTAINFDCNYNVNGLRYSWDFGDGTTSDLQRPEHTYQQQGVYTVKLVLRTSGGCQDSSVMSNLIRVTTTTAAFTMSDSFKICPPLLIQFTNNSVNAVSEYWDFGDSTSTSINNPSHFYTNPGSYTVRLYSTGPSGCVSVAQRSVIVRGPTGTFNYTPLRQCKPYLVNFTVNAANAISYIWDFNDGNTQVGTSVAVSHTYQDSGYFVPKLILIDDAGCRVAIRGRDTLTNLFVKAGFSIPNHLLCDGGNVSFINTSTSNDSITVYRWSFGDGQFSFDKNPVHQYSSVGEYYPSLLVTSRNGCSDSYRSLVPVRVTKSPLVSISGAVNGCAPLSVQLKAIQSNADTLAISQWNWNLGNGDSSAAAQPPPQVYQLPGTYTIQLSITGSNGCEKSILQQLEVYPSPAVQLLADSFVCLGRSASIAATGASRYRWNAAPGLQCDSCATVVVTPVATRFYSVTAFNAKGCSSRDSVEIAVQQPFKLIANGAASACAGQKKQLEANGAATYQWTPATGLNNPGIANPEASPTVTTNYQVIGKDQVGCFSDTGYVKVTVFPAPSVSAGADKEIRPGDPVDLIPEVSVDVTEVRWTPTGDQFRNSENAITVRPAETTEYTVKVKNAGGCTASDRVIVKVKPGAPTVFLPNLFSPNNDGVNELFYPRGTGVYKIKSMVIFNRWGEAIFQKSSFNSNDPSAGWDGTYRGAKMPADVYVYILEIIGEDGSIKPYKGNVTLAR